MLALSGRDVFGRVRTERFPTMTRTRRIAAGRQATLAFNLLLRIPFALGWARERDHGRTGER